MCIVYCIEPSTCDVVLLIAHWKIEGLRLMDLSSFLFAANQDDMMADAGVLSPTEFARRMLDKDQRKESLRNIKENIKEGLTEMRHEVKDTVKVFFNLRYQKNKF